jgi:hypothetical protein
MNSSRKLKIWTLLTQACIVVGAGHGAAPLILFEAMGFIQPFGDDIFQNKLSQAVLFFSVVTLVGQVCTIASILSNRHALKRQLHIIGISLLFASTFYIGAVVYFDPNSVFLYVTCLPFIVCVLLTILGSRLARFLNRLF